MGKPLAFPENRCYNYCKVIVRMMKEWGDPLFRLLWQERKGRRLEAGTKKKGSVAERVRQMAEPLAAGLHLMLWDVQFVKEGAQWYLRIFIDKEDGVGIDDCVDMTHALSPELDKEDPIPQEYMLEVSSPGLNRKLTRPEHFEAYLGAPVKVKLIRPLEDGRRELSGELVDFTPPGSFEVRLDEETSASFEKKECVSVTVMDDDF